MSHQNELDLVRRLDAARSHAEQSNNPADWARYFRLKDRADRKFRFVAEKPTPTRKTGRAA